MPVALVALSHSPLIGLNDPAQEVLDEVDHAIAGARKFVQEYDPELVVLFAPDHYNGFFYGKMPPFAIATGALAIGDFGSAEGEMLVDNEAANTIAKGVLERDIDLTISARMVVDHGFVQPLEMLFGGIQSVPTVPVFVNGVAAPLGPVRRIRQFGKALGEAAARLDKRVLFLASGGLSHDPPVPILEGAPPRVAEALILGNPPTPEQRARGEQRVVQSGIDLAAGTSTRKPLNPSGTTKFSTSSRPATSSSSTAGPTSSSRSRAAARRTRSAPGSRPTRRSRPRVRTSCSRATTAPSPSGWPVSR